METIRSKRLPPRVGQPATTAAMMREVLIALLPTLAMAVFFFGPRVLVLTALSVGSCLFFETLYRRLARLDNTVHDLSACVTGLLLALTIPVSSSWWVPVLGAAFAIILVKQFYGGLGKNFVNPALAGRMLLASFPLLMTRWPVPLQWMFSGVDAVSGATPLSYLHEGLLPPQTLRQLLLGQQGGSMGEVSSFMILLGGCYLLLRRVISPRIPLSFLGTVAALTLLFPQGGQPPVRWMLTQLLSGGLMLGAFFFATDPTTSPVTPRGQVMFGVGCGALTVLLRYFSSYPEGVGWAILTMNCCVWLCDRAGMPRRYGHPRFTMLRTWADNARADLRKIKFVAPDLSSLRSGLAPGEAHLDQIRSLAKQGASLVSVVVFGVHSYTDLKIAQADAQKQQELLTQVMPQASFSSELPYFAPGMLALRACYDEENTHLGYSVEVQVQGFSSAMTMDVGVDLDGKVTGVAVIDHTETASVGTRALSRTALLRYVGRSGTIRTSGENAVDAVTGATATSHAVTAGVNRALAIVANLDLESIQGQIEFTDGVEDTLE